MHRGRRLLRRACFAGAAASLLVFAMGGSLSTAQETEETARPPVFQSRASAAGIRAVIGTDPTTFIENPLSPTTPAVSATFGSGDRSVATAAIFDPGALITDGFSLLCQLGFPCSEITIPEYPLAANASYPTAVDESAQIQGPQLGGESAGLGAGQARAHAGLDFAHGAASVATANMGAPLLSVGSVDATSKSAFEGDVLVASARTVLTDVRIAGLLRIASIEVHSESRSSLTGGDENDAGVTVTGATLAGVPVAITEDGLALGGDALVDGGLLGQIGGLLNELLNDVLGIIQGSVRLLETSDVRDEALGASADAVGVQVDLRLDLSLLARANPVDFDAIEVSFILGTASSAARTAEALPPIVGGRGVTQPPVAAPPTSIVLPGRPAIPATPGTPGRQGSAARSTVIRRTTQFELLRGSIELVYLAATLSAVGLALGSRAAPLRLVGRRR